MRRGGWLAGAAVLAAAWTAPPAGAAFDLVTELQNFSKTTERFVHVTARPEYQLRLRAFVALRSGSEVSEDDLKEHVRRNLARYKIPREVVFVDELPRNPTGKLLKSHLAEIA